MSINKLIWCAVSLIKGPTCAFTLKNLLRYIFRITMSKLPPLELEDRITAVLSDTQWWSYTIITLRTSQGDNCRWQPTHRKHYYSLVIVQYPNAYQLEFNRLDCFRNLQLMLMMVQKFNQFGLVCTAYGISIISIHARKWNIIQGNIL